MSWRPIESAPKDGTPIDLWVAHAKPDAYDRACRHTDCRWVNGAWCEWDDKIEDWDGVEQLEPLRDGRSWKATHWQPLPTPPDNGE